VGRGPHFRVGGTTHHTNENAICVGKTSSARKGTAKSDTFYLLCSVDPAWVENRHLRFFFRFARYSQRGEVHWVVFAIAALVGGFVIARTSRHHPFRACTHMLATICIAQLGLIVVDIVLIDRTAHNLAPFEFLSILFFGATAFAGAAIGRLTD